VGQYSFLRKPLHQKRWPKFIGGFPAVSRSAADLKSLSDRLLKLMKKGVSVEQSRSRHQSLSDADIFGSTLI